MNEGALTLRDARPTLEEGLAFARYLDEAAEGFFRLMLGRRVSEIVARAFVEPGHGLSYENVTFAERDGVIVGMFSAYTGEGHGAFSDGPLREAAGPAALRMRFVRTILAPLWRILEEIPVILRRELGQSFVRRFKIENELRMAKEIQKALAPQELPAIEGYRISAYCEPARHVSGDFYDIATLPSGNSVAFLGDVAGKGVAASLLSSMALFPCWSNCIFEIRRNLELAGNRVTLLPVIYPGQLQPYPDRF